MPEIYDVRETPLVGIYVSTHTARVKDNYGKEADGKRDATIHVFREGQNGENGEVAVFGKPDLDGKISQLSPGDLCRIEFAGYEDLAGGKRLATFSVQRAAGATPTAASHADAGAAGTDDDIPF
jgi:hypothetical protein